MRSFLQGRLAFARALQASSFDVTHHDLMLILTSIISACAAHRWPGEGFDRKRFVESLIKFSPPHLCADYISIGALLELNLISEDQTEWRKPGQGDRVFTGEDVDCALLDMANRYPQLSTCELKKASYANKIYEWLRCGYAHTYWTAGNTTRVAPSQRPAQISYIGRIQSDDTTIRIAAFHLDYIFNLVQEQVSTLSDRPLQRPSKWWIDAA